VDRPEITPEAYRYIPVEHIVGQVIHGRDVFSVRLARGPGIIRGHMYDMTMSGIQADSISCGVSEPLLAFEVSLSGRAFVAEEEMDLLDLTAGVMAQTRKCADHMERHRYPFEAIRPAFLISRNIGLAARAAVVNHA
jgi:hypothetical protein